jgi:hypothetical protein
MIFMDNKGFIFTLDAALALIPIFIVIVAVANIGDLGVSPQARFAQNAQDTLEIMSNPHNNVDSSIIQNMADILAANNNSDGGIQEAGKIADSFLNKTLPNSKYSMIEINQLNRTITSNGDINKAKDTSVGFKSSGNYIFKLYIWN